jgi:hypothetical protein
MERLKYIAPEDIERKLLRRMRGPSIAEVEACRPLVQQWKDYWGPEYFGPGSSISILWHCPGQDRNGKTRHKPCSYKSQVCRRGQAAIKGSKFLGCPYCCGRKKLVDSGLAKLYPEIAKELVAEEDSALEMNPRAEQMCKWKCENNHTYSCMVSARTIDGQGCPQCYSGERVDLASALPEILERFEHFDRNSGHDLRALPVNYKVWWQCSHENSQHSFYKSFAQLRETKFGCPKCQRKCADTLCHYPRVAAQFHPTFNGKLKPVKLAAGSNSQVWWLCPKHPDSPYQAQVFTHCIRADGCPFCANRRSCPENCLATRHPLLAAEFHPTMNGSLTPETIVGSGSRVCAWLCSSCGFEYSRQLSSRIRGAKCPGCGIKSVPGKEPTEPATNKITELDTRDIDKATPLLQRCKPSSNEGYGEHTEVEGSAPSDECTLLLQSCKPNTSQAFARDASIHQSFAGKHARKKCLHMTSAQISLLNFKKNAGVLEL